MRVCACVCLSLSVCAKEIDQKVLVTEIAQIFGQTAGKRGQRAGGTRKSHAHHTHTFAHRHRLTHPWCAVILIESKTKATNGIDGADRICIDPGDNNGQHRQERTRMSRAEHAKRVHACLSHSLSLSLSLLLCLGLSVCLTLSCITSACESFLMFQMAPRRARKYATLFPTRLWLPSSSPSLSHCLSLVL